LGDATFYRIWDMYLFGSNGKTVYVEGQNNMYASDEIECPYCAERIKAKAKKCKHCGEIIDWQIREFETRRLKNPAGLIPYKHFWHAVFTLLTCGWWFVGWFFCWLWRDKSIYY